MSVSHKNQAAQSESLSHPYSDSKNLLAVIPDNKIDIKEESGLRRQVTSNAVNVSREHGGLIRGVVGNMELKRVGVKEPEFDGIMRANVRVKVRMLKWILSKAVEE